MKQVLKLRERREFLKSTCKTFIAGMLLSLFGIKPKVARAENAYDPEKHRYAMGIDIHKCIGCGKCVGACKTENDVPREPHYFRTWIERYVIPVEGEPIVDSPNGGIAGFPKISGDTSILKSFFVPKLCNQCESPPCVQVCPVGATFKSPDGVILVDKNYCLGCSYCIQACPYGARYMNPKTRTADKCTFCYHRITKELLPACVEVCPTKARIFGEVGKQSSPLRRFARFNDISVLKQELNTKPTVYYAGAGGKVT